jgi:DNA adenine methylase
MKRAPSSFRTYREPFVGGGAMFFALQPRCAVLSDANRELIATYTAIRDDVEAVIERLESFDVQHSDETYYHIRSETPRWQFKHDVAARMIYLNKTGFNGLYRVNSKGRFNVPVGRFKSLPTICDRENLRACSSALAGKILECSDWRSMLWDRGDFCYFDPPYVPASATANFTGYTSNGFEWSDQVALANRVAEMKRGGVQVMASNADTPEIVALYEGLGLKVEHLTCRRNINRDGAKRGPVGEVIIT